MRLGEAAFADQWATGAADRFAVLLDRDAVAHAALDSPGGITICSPPAEASYTHAFFGIDTNACLSRRERP